MFEKKLLKLTFLTSFLFVGIITLGMAQTALQKGVYVVQEGENLYRIALRNKVSVTKLCQWNALQPTDPLIAGRKLMVASPQNAPETMAARLAPAKTHKQAGNVHRVQSGETVAMIANTYGYTEERFRQFNSLKNSEKVEPGRELKSCDCSCTENNEPSSKPVGNAEQKGKAKPQSMIAKKANSPKPINNQSNYDWQPNASNRRVVQETKPVGDGAESANTATAATPAANPPTNKQAESPKTTDEDADKAAETKAIKDASTSSFMNAEEMAMVDEINLARTSPKIYVQYVEEYIKHLQENNDNEAIAAANELISTLKTMPPQKALATSECVFTAAKKHALDQKPKGDIDHQGRDGSFPWDRIPKECPMMKDGGECLVGGGKTVRRSVMMLLVDSGIANRGHRTTILDATWEFVACYKIGTVGTMTNYWIQNFGK